MTQKYLLVFFFLSLLFSTNSNAQYNFFVGTDANQLNTSVKGFGSISFPSFMLNQSKIMGTPMSKFRKFYSINIGFNWKQWRLADNQSLVKDDNKVIKVKPHPFEEKYNNGFFSYSKSKLVTGVIRIRPEFGFTTSNKKFSIGTGPLFEFTLAAKHKRKFYDNGSKSKMIQKGVEYYNLNWFQFGWGASIGTYHFGAFSYVMLTPMFKEELGPKVNAAEVGLYWRILKENYPKLKPVDKFSQAL